MGTVPTRAQTQEKSPRQEIPSVAAGGIASRETGTAISEVPADSAVPHVGLCVPKESVRGAALEEGRGSGFTSTTTLMSITTALSVSTQVLGRMFKSMLQQSVMNKTQEFICNGD